MAMVDLNIADDDTPSYEGQITQAPCLYLTAAQAKALGITEPPRAGVIMSMTAQVMVERVSESIDGDMDDPDITLTLCVTHAELGAPAASREAASAIYGG